MDCKPPLIVIAAGGDGSRIGGDKPGRLLDGQRLIDRAIRWAQRHSDRVALALRDGGDDWNTGLPVLADRDTGIGPISALISAMEEARRCHRDRVLLIGCDLPLLPDDLVPRLTAALPGHAVAMPVSGGRLHPLAALWRCQPDTLSDWVRQGGQSLWRYARHIGLAEVVWPAEPDVFANVNDSGTLAEIENRLRMTGL